MNIRIAYIPISVYKIGFGGCGARSIRGRVLFCSNNATVRSLIEGAVYYCD